MSRGTTIREFDPPGKPPGWLPPEPPSIVINENALKEAVMHQCAITFNGPHAICICKERGDMSACRFGTDRLRSVIKEYLTHARGR